MKFLILTGFCFSMVSMCFSGEGRLSSTDLSIGQRGRLPISSSQRVVIFQILDKQNMLVNFEVLPSRPVGYAREVKPGGVSIEAMQMAAKGAPVIYDIASVVKISGVLTEGLVNDKVFTSADWFEVSSTTTYTTAVGTNTVFVLKPIEDPALEQQREATNREARAAAKKLSDAEARETAKQEKKAAAIAAAKKEDAERIKNAALFSLADGTFIWAKRDTDLGENWSVQSTEGKWYLIKKADVLSIKRPE